MKQDPFNPPRMLGDRTVYQQIASHLAALHITTTPTWATYHDRALDWLAKQFLPHGSGVDCGTKIDRDWGHKHNFRKGFRLSMSYHHMNDGGYYDGWTEHVVTVTPSWGGIDLAISGRDRNGIKEYLYETTHAGLTDVCARPKESGGLELGWYWWDDAKKEHTWHPHEIGS